MPLTRNLFISLTSLERLQTFSKHCNIVFKIATILQKVYLFIANGIYTADGKKSTQQLFLNPWNVTTQLFSKRTSLLSKRRASKTWGKHGPIKKVWQQAAIQQSKETILLQTLKNISTLKPNLFYFFLIKAFNLFALVLSKSLFCRK